ncbi:cysteine-rich receptor-like protein kinase 26 [Tanacetum coccineum]
MPDRIMRKQWILVPESLQYDFGTVQVATNDFSEENQLGQGGFGAVYKGVFEDGQEIAVKRLAMDSGQGDVEFKNEVLLVAKLQHRNLVRLLGFSIHGNERLLIYEILLQMQDLITFITLTLAWRGCLNNKNLKPTLVELLEPSMEQIGKTRHRLDKISSHIEHRDLPESLRSIIRSIHIGLLCVQENVTDRPTMGSIVLMLNSMSILLAPPSQPAFLVHSTITNPEIPILPEFSSSSGSSGLERPELSTINLPYPHRPFFSK